MVDVREVEPDVYWFQECSPFLEEHFAKKRPDWYDGANETHLPNNAFLFCGEENLIFDTLSLGCTSELLDRLEEVLDGDGLDYVVVSHGESPHAGNARHLLQKYPNAELVASSDVLTVQKFGIEEAKLVEPNEVIDLGGFVVRFLEATFPDTTMSLWMFEETTRTLLTVDWLGFFHTDRECLACAHELDHEVSVDRQMEFAARTLRWLEFAKPARIIAETDHLIDEYEPSSIGSAHGTVFQRSPVEQMERFKTVVDRISEEGGFGSIA